MIFFISVFSSSPLSESNMQYYYPAPLQGKLPPTGYPYRIGVAYIVGAVITFRNILQEGITFRESLSDAYHIEYIIILISVILNSLFDITSIPDTKSLCIFSQKHFLPEEKNHLTTDELSQSSDGVQGQGREKFTQKRLEKNKLHTGLFQYMQKKSVCSNACKTEQNTFLKKYHFFIISLYFMLQNISIEKSQDNQTALNNEQHTQSQEQMLSSSDLQKRLKQICEKSHILPDPKYLCCLRRVYKGRLNLLNLEHQYILLLDPKSNLQEKNSSLKRALCAALNYQKNVVILIGGNNELQTLGISLQSVQQFSQSLQNAIKFISPTPEENLEVKKIPIILKQSQEQTEKYLITIKTMNKKNELHYFLRPRYYPTYHYLYSVKKQIKCKESKKQKYHNASLQISCPQGEKLYKLLRSIYLNKHKLNHYRHNHQCFKSNQSISVKQQICSLQQFQNIKTYTQKYDSFSNFAIVKFKSQNEIFQHNNVINAFEMSLSSPKKNFIIIRIKQNLKSQLDEQKKVQTQKVIFFFIIMHNFQSEFVKKVIKKESSKAYFEYYEGSQAFKLSKFKTSTEFNIFKEKDRFFISLFQSAFPLQLVVRFMKIIKENQEKLTTVYYKINLRKSNHSLISLIFAFLVNQRLGFSPQFINQKIISNPIYDCPFKK